MGCRQYIIIKLEDSLRNELISQAENDYRTLPNFIRLILINWVRNNDENKLNVARLHEGVSDEYFDFLKDVKKDVDTNYKSKYLELKKETNKLRGYLRHQEKLKEKKLKKHTFPKLPKSIKKNVTLKKSSTPTISKKDITTTTEKKQFISKKVFAYDSLSPDKIIMSYVDVYTQEQEEGIVGLIEFKEQCTPVTILNDIYNVEKWLVEFNDGFRTHRKFLIKTQQKV